MFLVSLGLVNIEGMRSAVPSPSQKLDGVFKLLTNLIYCKDYFAKSKLMSEVSLFPSMLTSTIHNISNRSAFFPSLCAADDLELSLSGHNDQIEFFNSFTVTSGGTGANTAASSNFDSHESRFASSSVTLAGPSPSMNFDYVSVQSKPAAYSEASSAIPIYSPRHQTPLSAQKHHIQNNHQSSHDSAPLQHTTHNLSQSYHVQDHMSSSFSSSTDYCTNREYDEPASSNAPALFPVQELFVEHKEFLPTQDVNLGDSNFASSLVQPGQSVDGGYSHYYLNMIGMQNPEYHNNPPFFNDFSSTEMNNGLNVYGLLGSSVSSNDSNVSPLDDEFFKKLSSEECQTYPQPQMMQNQYFPKYAFEEDAGSAALFDVANQNYSISDPAVVKKRKFESISSTVSSNMTDEMSNMSSPSVSDNSEYTSQRKNSAKVFVKKETPSNTKESLETSKGHQTTKKTKTQDPKVARNSVSSAQTSHGGSAVSAAAAAAATYAGETLYECCHCDASFKVKGYLSRHLKKHSSSKAFLCPFYEEPAGSSSGTKCHPTGGFSRRDTYKTHLKALHFIYPPGTKSNERNSISGRCAGCFQYFDNNLKWLEKHIESGDCKGTVQFKKSLDYNHEKHHMQPSLHEEHRHENHHSLPIHTQHMRKN